MSTQVAAVFEWWAFIETHLTSLLVAATPPIDRFRKLEEFQALSRRRQREFLTAQIRLTTSKFEADIFDAAMANVVNPVQKTRDRFAHWIWASCPEIESPHLCLIKPSYWTKRYSETLGLLTPATRKADLRRVFVYDMHCMERVITACAIATNTSAEFVIAIRENHSDKRSELFHKLSRQPQIQKGLSHPRLQKKNGP
jgi:hypothetical protein